MELDIKKIDVILVHCPFKCIIHFHLYSLQLVKEGLTKAQQELSAASTDEAKAEAQIAIEVHEAMEKAVSK